MKYDRWSRDGMPDGDAMRRIQSGIDATMRDVLVNRTISQSSSMIPDRARSPEPERPASGGTAPLTVSGLNYVDAMCDAQDRIDRAAAVRVKIDTEFAERLLDMDKGPRIESEYEPFDANNMKK